MITADIHTRLHCIAHGHSVSCYDRLLYKGHLTDLDDLCVQWLDWVAVLVGTWSCLTPWGLSVGLSKGSVYTSVWKTFQWSSNLRVLHSDKHEDLWKSSAVRVTHNRHGMLHRGENCIRNFGDKTSYKAATWNAKKEMDSIVIYRKGLLVMWWEVDRSSGSSQVMRLVVNHVQSVSSASRKLANGECFIQIYCWQFDRYTYFFYLYTPVCFMMQPQ